ncbi:DUF6371 domain-containing protein [uncultured Hymenobacter sp.]|uniref:DUF6371 domain-containing protein n=1 Tax=uncultured Hymenobacter sp. TaxID=170016 RepID=UPI0035C9E389
MNEHQFMLEHYAGRSSRYTCPACEKPHEFSRYLDLQTGEHLGERVGRCSREAKCKYHYTPKQHFADNPGGSSFNTPFRVASVSKKPLPRLLPSVADALPWDVVERSLSRYECNGFVRGLATLFTEPLALDLARRYLIGTARGGGTVFWQVDDCRVVRTGKIIDYDASTLKRIKHRADGNEVVPQWAHTKLRRSGYQLRQCLFGQHLLATDGPRPVAIVEAEKTAVLCSIYLPGYLWLATGGCSASQFKDADVLAALRQHEVILFPDTGTTDKWEVQAKALRKAGVRVRVCRDLEAAQLNRPPNWDLADEFLAFAQTVVLTTGTVRWALTEPGGYPVFWDYLLA